MPTVLQLRRGTTAQNDAFTGSAGELTFNTTTGALRAHDGTTAGGAEMLVNTGSNANISQSVTLTGAVTGSGTITNLGNLTIATTATNDPTITLAGDLSGSCTLTNLGDATLTATIAANSVALGTDTTGNYVAAGATSGNGISGSVSSEGGTFTVTSNATSDNTASTIVYRDISGNFSAGTITGTATTAQYADLAENYMADEAYAAGTVIAFGGAAEVTIANTFASRNTAGVVSTKPAHLMNSELTGDTVVALALAGRVPCRVVGVVRKGDLMVASNTPGCAIAWGEELRDPPAGSIIGKALEDKSGQDEGIIEVVVGVR